MKNDIYNDWQKVCDAYDVFTKAFIAGNYGKEINRWISAERRFEIKYDTEVDCVTGTCIVNGCIVLVRNVRATKLNKGETTK